MLAESAFRDLRPADFQLIETIRWEPGGGFVRLPLHLARLRMSATQLGFGHDPDRIDQALNDAVARSDIALRVRLALSRGGRVVTESRPYQPLPAGTVWTLRLAATRVDSAEVLVGHKTSRREVYRQARAEYPIARADEVLLANERGEVCEGTITNVYADVGDGALVTPQLGCGLLPGVLRRELLIAGRAREGVLTEADLRRAPALFVGNSLRGLISASLPR